MATGAIARRPTVCGPFPALPILLRRAVTAVAGGLRVCTRQRPRAVVDSWRLPSPFGVATCAATVAHFRLELLTVRVVVAVDAPPRPELQIVPGSFPLVTPRTANRLMLSVERKLGTAVLFDREQRRPEPMLIMAARTIRGPETASMDITVAVPALLELEAPESPLNGELG